ncbi:MAG: zonular occludens toxin domain-containing protein [Nanoarchaeota archaeon]
MGILDMFIKKKKVEEPYVPFSIIKTSKGDFEDFSQRLLKGSNIVLITGKRGSGKTALGMKFLEMFRKMSKRRVFAMGFESAKLPSGIKKVSSIDEIPNNGIALLDEGAVIFSSRESMKSSNKELGKIMAIARHKNLSLILITQNSAMIDLNVLRLADTIVLKEPSLLQAKFERKAIKDMYESVAIHFKELKNKKAHFYMMDDEFEGLVNYSLPEFWNESISKSFKDIK